MLLLSVLASLASDHRLILHPKVHPSHLRWTVSLPLKSHSRMFLKQQLVRKRTDCVISMTWGDGGGGDGDGIR